MALRTVRVRKIDVLGAALLSTVASAVAGLFIGILFLLSSLFMGSVLADIPLIGRAIADLWTSAGVVVLIASPIIFAILGFVVGAVAAVCVNAVLPRMDGLQLEADLDAETLSRGDKAL
jgi:hypothetical protein